MKPIKFEDLKLTEDEMEKIAAGARIFLASEEDEFEAANQRELDNLEIEDAPPEAPSELVTVTRRNLRE